MGKIFKATPADIAKRGPHALAAVQAEVVEFRAALMAEVARRVQLQTFLVVVLSKLGDGQPVSVTQEEMKAATDYDTTVERVKGSDGKVTHLSLALVKREKDNAEGDAEGERGVPRSPEEGGSKEGSGDPSSTG